MIYDLIDICEHCLELKSCGIIARIKQTSTKILFSNDFDQTNPEFFPKVTHHTICQSCYESSLPSYYLDLAEN